MKKFLAIIAFLGQTTFACLADDWMSQLDDNAYLSQVSIPGTHDSATGEGWTGFFGELLGPSMGLTQDLTIAQQLDCGVRAFDLRPCVLENELVINHGILQTQAKFFETLQQLCQFVTEHPTEFVVVIMRHEIDGDDNSSLWADMMNNCLNSEDILPHLANYKREITVADLRGKVLVLSRDKYANKPVGGLITGWGHQADYVTGSIKGPEGGPGTLYVQDFYEVMDQMTAKLNGIVKLLDFSTKNNVYHNTRHLVVCVNYASGYTVLASTDGIRDNATQCNHKIIDYLADETHAGPAGIVFMDFAGTDTSGSYDVKGLALVNAIISNNQRYSPVKNEESVGITLPDSHQEATESCYDLLGRKQQNQPHRPAIIIRNGRKVVSK